MSSVWLLAFIVERDCRLCRFGTLMPASDLAILQLSSLDLPCGLLVVPALTLDRTPTPVSLPFWYGVFVDIYFFLLFLDYHRHLLPFSLRILLLNAGVRCYPSCQLCYSALFTELLATFCDCRLFRSTLSAIPFSWDSFGSAKLASSQRQANYKHC